MTDLPTTIDPDRWVTHLFSAKAAAEGGVLRRKVEDVERLLGRTRFMYELDRRGYHAVQNAGQFVIFCNQEPVLVIR